MSDSETHVTFQAPEIAQLAPLFPGYEFEILIATGGMGAVYRAVQKSLDRTVAIKILPDEFSNDAAFCAGFEAEAKAMARLNHPNLIGVYDFGEINGMLYIIMEYVPGQSLYHSSNGIAIDPGEVIRIVSCICNGLAHAHEHGILHRDIKPSNILLDLNAQPKIGDFGLARPVERKVEVGEEIFGTPHYTAPEVVEAPHSVDHRADIFSIGVMLHELLTGILPANDLRSASAIIHCDPRFDAIIRRATNPQPEARYSSAAEIANDLHVIASTAGPRVLQTNAPQRPIPGITRPTIHPQKKSSSAPGVVITLIILAIGAVVFSVFSGKTPKEIVDVPQPPPTTTTDVDQRPSISPPEADSQPEPEPEPEPESDTTSLPIPEPEIDMVPETKPETAAEPAPAAEPIFDVNDFFGRARKIMTDKAAPLIDSHSKEASENFESFGRAIKRKARKVYSQVLRDRIEANLESSLAQWHKRGDIIPDDLELPLSNIPEYPEVLIKYGDDRTQIDQKLEQELAELSKTYVLGLELQIGRLDATEDPVAVKLIQDEIDRTKNDPGYFSDLMQGNEIYDDE